MQDFEFKETRLKGSYLIKPFYSTDSRGGLIKDYNMDVFVRNGLSHNLKEVFYTVSMKGVIRAIHFQLGKQQAKLVRCIKGRIYDIIVDLRKDSPTFGQWEGFELTGETINSLYIPEYFGHGYLVIEDSIICYMCNEVFHAEGDSGILYSDPDLGIEWPLARIGGSENIIISEKDRNLMTFKEYKGMITA